MKAFAWVVVDHLLHLVLLILGLLHYWRCRSLVVVEKEVVDILDVLPRFLHLGMSHLWMLPYQLLVHLVMK